jgi:hypothetical protein
MPNKRIAGDLPGNTMKKVKKYWPSLLIGNAVVGHS